MRCCGQAAVEASCLRARRVSSLRADSSEQHGTNRRCMRTVEETFIDALREHRGPGYEPRKTGERINNAQSAFLTGWRTSRSAGPRPIPLSTPSHRCGVNYEPSCHVPSPPATAPVDALGRDSARCLSCERERSAPSPEEARMISEGRWPVDNLCTTSEALRCFQALRLLRLRLRQRWAAETVPDLCGARGIGDPIDSPRGPPSWTRKR